MESFYSTLFVGIIVGLLTWSLRQPAERTDDGGIVLKVSKVVYIVVALPVIGVLLILPLALTELRNGVESLYIIGMSILVTLLYAWLVVFLNNQKIIANDGGVTGKKGKNNIFLKWSDINNVKYSGLNGRMKLIGDNNTVTVNLEMVGGVEFLNLLRQKLPTALCEDAVKRAGRRMKRYGFN